ncbi:MAG TPA: 30S ribosomal protein S4 [Oligoflexia bacterium]|nr:30S ribosomal protein S4 [Oligoflexia bacterium]HMP26474.1 30S ribosomal protein S4 [Oligoflexia bacterium]
MGRYIGPVCRLCRREGAKLFLKGERCFGSKCAFERRQGTPPGQHGRGRQAFSVYKIQLRAKQQVKRIFGLMEDQIRAYYEKATNAEGVTGTELLVALERRLDNMVYRMGLASSRKEARQLVAHGHILVNNKRVNIPSYAVAVGDKIQLKENSKKKPIVQQAIAAAEARVLPEWVSLDKHEISGTLKALPTREQLPDGLNEQMIVDLYSR